MSTSLESSQEHKSVNCMPHSYLKVVGNLEDKISNSPTPIPTNGYDAARCPPILSSVEFPTFAIREQATLSVFVVCPTKIGKQTEKKNIFPVSWGFCR